MGALLLLCLIVAGIGLAMVKVSEASTKKNVEFIQNNTAAGIDNISSELQKIGFVTTRKIAINYLGEIHSCPLEELRVDSNSKRVAICNYETARFTCLNFEQILSCELIEDKDVVYDSGIGRAVVGAVVAGDVGAIVGSNSAKDKIYVDSLTIRVTTANVDNPQIILETLSNRWRKDNDIYKNILNHAREIFTIFNSIVLSNRMGK